MPLTQVIDYFNAHLEALNPQASLRRHGRYLYENGQVSAELAGKRLQPSQRPILELAGLKPMAHESRMQLADRHSVQETTDPLYFFSWDREDVIFLDRFLRVLHALHHLSLHGVDAAPLVVDVHWRHLQAVEASHGAVFEALLAKLGLHPREVVLRLSALRLLTDSHAREASRSFQNHGYPLLAHGVPLDVESQSWHLLLEAGVEWVTPEPNAMILARRGREHWPRIAEWNREARAAGLTVWWPGVDTPGDLGAVTPLGPTLVSGRLLGDRLQQDQRVQ
ncbi:hypothetical protein [Chromohalobacter israelensis]|uniref:hypothetical protein n=1 Tax=Chromohalobacter israelensis TaxID=141390 RepID=UPI000D70C6F1|nr:hypothetical protein [Chromohalobacter salexigens]PWW37058.1 hypothetical protein DFO74_11139 [Chromohalobacter salexigens]